MTMPITSAQYKDMKEYWDYQRKVQYNREVIYNIADQMKNKAYNEFGPMSIEEVKKHLWDRVETDDYEDPPKGWIPEDDKLRFDWEPDPKDKRLPPPKGRPVILKAKPGWEKKLNDDNDI